MSIEIGKDAHLSSGNVKIVDHFGKIVQVEEYGVVYTIPRGWLNGPGMPTTVAVPRTVLRWLMDYAARYDSASDTDNARRDLVVEQAQECLDAR